MARRTRRGEVRLTITQSGRGPRVVDSTPWRWPWRFRLTQRIELLSGTDARHEAAVTAASCRFASLSGSSRPGRLHQPVHYVKRHDVRSSAPSESRNRRPADR